MRERALQLEPTAHLGYEKRDRGGYGSGNARNGASSCTLPSSRMCLDTYDRELERHGGPAAMSLAESIFGADSRFTVEPLRLSRTGVLALDLTILGVLTVVC